MPPSPLPSHPSYNRHPPPTTITPLLLPLPTTTSPPFPAPPPLINPVIDITIFITAQHGGRHEFHLCPSPHVSKGCLKEHQLER